MSVTASEAREILIPLIRKANGDHEAVEIVSGHGNAVLVSAEDGAALCEGLYLLHSRANAPCPGVIDVEGTPSVRAQGQVEYHIAVVLASVR